MITNVAIAIAVAAAVAVISIQLVLVVVAIIAVSNNTSSCSNRVAICCNTSCSNTIYTISVAIILSVASIAVVAICSNN